jgi:hypothetical protein
MHVLHVTACVARVVQAAHPQSVVSLGSESMLVGEASWRWHAAFCYILLHVARVPVWQASPYRISAMLARPCLGDCSKALLHP